MTVEFRECVNDVLENLATRDHKDRHAPADPRAMKIMVPLSRCQAEHLVDAKEALRLIDTRCAYLAEIADPDLAKQSE